MQPPSHPVVKALYKPYSAVSNILSFHFFMENIIFKTGNDDQGIENMVSIKNIYGTYITERLTEILDQLRHDAGRYVSDVKKFFTDDCNFTGDVSVVIVAGDGMEVSATHTSLGSLDKVKVEFTAPPPSSTSTSTSMMPEQSSAKGYTVASTITGSKQGKEQ